MLIFCLMSLFAFMSIFVFMGVLQGDQNFVMNLNCDQEENSNFFACVEDKLFIKKQKKYVKIFIQLLIFSKNKSCHIHQKMRILPSKT